MRNFMNEAIQRCFEDQASMLFSYNEQTKDKRYLTTLGKSVEKMLLQGHGHLTEEFKKALPKPK